MATMSTLARKLRELEQRIQRQRGPARWATAYHAEGGPVALRLPGGRVLTVASVDEARRIALEGGMRLINIVDPNLEPEAGP